MLRKAREQNLSRITICEDDVEFPADWETRYHHALAYLDRNDDWDVFSGLIADLHEDTYIYKIEGKNEDEQDEFVYIDQTVSTVFNVYAQSSFAALLEWDSDNRDVNGNTIDRFMQRNRSFRIVTTAPFLVGHKEECYSTLWNGKNSIYVDLIKKSEASLRSKVAVYKKRQPADSGEESSS